MPNFSYSATAAPTTAPYTLAGIEVGTKPVWIKRLTIWNPGMMTSAQMTTVSLVTMTAAGSGTTGAAAPLDAANSGFSGTIRAPGSTAGTAGTVVWGPAGIWSPGANASAAPFVADFTNNGTRKGIPVPSGVTAPVAATGTANGTWYQVAALGTTTQAQWIAAGASGYVNVGTVFTAGAAAADGTGLVRLMTPASGIFLRVNNGAAGGANMAYTLDFQEGL
jgi:hypothetical protein